MNTETEGIVLRQTKTVNGRRMITLFSKRYGKISAGTSISERGKNKTALALRPFSYGRYELFKSRSGFSINGAETIQGYYGIGEDIDKFFAASYVLELCEKLLPEEEPQTDMFFMLQDYLALLENRKTSYDTLTAVFMFKALAIEGVAPQLDSCVRNGSDDIAAFSVKDAGVISKEKMTPGDELDPLCFSITPTTLNVMRYMVSKPIKSFEKLSADPAIEKQVMRILKDYYSFHMGIDRLKSEGLRI